MILETHYLCKNEHNLIVQYKGFFEKVHEACPICGAEFKTVAVKTVPDKGEVMEIEELKEQILRLEQLIEEIVSLRSFTDRAEAVVKHKQRHSEGVDHDHPRS